MHGGREICRRSDAGPFSNNPARADPRYQTNPTIEAQTFGLSLFSRLSAENQTILKISKRTRTPTETKEKSIYFSLLVYMQQKASLIQVLGETLERAQHVLNERMRFIRVDVISAITPRVRYKNKNKKLSLNLTCKWGHEASSVGSSSSGSKSGFSLGGRVRNRFAEI